MEMCPGKKEGSRNETRYGQVLQVLTVRHVDFIL